MDNIGTPFGHLQMSAVPWVRCPKCRHPLVQAKAVIDEQSFVEIDRKIRSQQAHPMDDQGSFSARLTCSGCGERLLAAGDWDNDIDFDDGEEHIVRYYRPRYFSHTPSPLTIPKRAPSKVKAEIARAGRLFWIDLAACATALRRVVESFLDSQKISRRGRKGSFLHLAARIDRYVAKFPAARAPQLKRFLHAVRLTGNAGTHAKEITPGDVKLMADWISRVLQLKYPERDPVLAAAVARTRPRRRIDAK